MKDGPIWETIATAPYDRDLELAVIEADRLHPLVFACRRTANGWIIPPHGHFVSLPSWSSLSSRGGGEYQVRLSYKGRSSIAPVYDVGPYSERDDYWDIQRNGYPQLERGWSMDHAAYYERGGHAPAHCRVRVAAEDGRCACRTCPRRHVDLDGAPGLDILDALGATHHVHLEGFGLLLIEAVCHVNGGCLLSFE